MQAWHSACKAACKQQPYRSQRLSANVALLGAASFLEGWVLAGTGTRRAPGGPLSLMMWDLH